MGSSQLLHDKPAVVFGAGGSVGAAIAKEFADQAAEVFLAGRTASNVEEVKKQIVAKGGRAHAALIDAVDDAAVNEYIDGIARRVGSIDIVFNAIGPLATQYANGKSAVDLTVAASVTDTAKAAAFLAADDARMTGTVLNSSGGAVAD
jgi:NADP-dependent 3-hydroxy acid dehydrogenase YdfG